MNIDRAFVKNSIKNERRITNELARVLYRMSLTSDSVSRLYGDEMDEYKEYRDKYKKVAPNVLRKLENKELTYDYFDRKKRDVKSTYLVSDETYIFTDALGLLHFGKKK